MLKTLSFIILYFAVLHFLVQILNAKCKSLKEIVMLKTLSFIIFLENHFLLDVFMLEVKMATNSLHSFIIFSKLSIS